MSSVRDSTSVLGVRPLDNGKPAAKRGRKATGLLQAAGLPKEDSMPRVLSRTALTICAASFLIYGCEQMPLTEGPANPVPPLGQCEPDETAAACETSCARLSACDVAP